MEHEAGGKENPVLLHPEGEAVPGHMDYTVDYTDVLRQGLGEWSPNGKFLAGAQQSLGREAAEGCARRACNKTKQEVNCHRI